MKNTLFTYRIHNFAIITKSISIVMLLVISSLGNAQDVSRPPEIGQETKGTPAISETNAGSTNQESVNQEVEGETVTGTKIVELRRESGQIYQIELQHSSGSTQYITETDSDGNIEFTDNDIEKTPNLPKWKVGSW